MRMFAHSLPPPCLSHAVRFFLLGFWNNFTWVALNAGAGDIVPGQYALIYLVNQVSSAPHPWPPW